MSLAQSFDETTIKQLRARGSTKWTTFPDAIGAFVAEMDFGTAPQVTAALVSAVEQNQIGYAPPHLVEALQRAFVDFAANRYGWILREDQVRPVPDVLGACEATMRLLVPPNAIIALPTPAYMPFRPLLRHLGRRIIEIPMLFDGTRWVNDVAGIEAAFEAGASWLVLVNPHNPTGRVLSRAELTEIAEIVDRHDGRVFADEIHAPLVYPGPDAPRHIPYASLSPATAAHTVTATSASKAWNLPGLKAAGLILTNDDDLATWLAHGSWAEHLTSTLGMEGQIAAYNEGEEWLAEVLDYLAGNRALVGEFLAQRLPRVRYSPPEGTYLTWLDLRDYHLLDAEGRDRPAAWLREHAKVALTEGHDCGVVGDGFARLNIATPRPILKQALEQIAEALEGAENNAGRLSSGSVGAASVETTSSAAGGHARRSTYDGPSGGFESLNRPTGGFESLNRPMSPTPTTDLS